MATSVMRNTIKAETVGRYPDANTRIPAGGTLDFDTGVTVKGTIYGIAPIYAGHYKCVITNTWVSNSIRFTILNPTDAEATLDTTQMARVCVIHS